MKPFKNRIIDYSKPVMIYRNLNCRRGIVDYSIKQGTLVVAHTSNVALNNVEFKINKSGQARARKQKIRNVHAFAIGYIDIGTLHVIDKLKRITYNPFNDDTFIIADNNISVFNAKLTLFNQKGVFIIE